MTDTYLPFADEKAPSISRPDRDVSIPITLKEVREDKSVIYIPVSIKDKEYNVIFDSGAGLTFFTESFAKEIGVRILKDSIFISGVAGNAYGWFGILDKMKVGEIEYKDILCVVAPPNELDSIIRIDAILGLDFLKQVKEFQIFPNDKKVVFPFQQTELPASGRNLLLSNNQSYLKTYTPNGERLIFHFDTGNAGSTSLLSNYYEKHKDYIETNFVREKRESGGFGGMRKVDVFILPEISFKVGNAISSNKIVPVFPNKSWGVQTFEDGSVGMNFIKQFKKITVNYEKMFLNVE